MRPLALLLTLGLLLATGCRGRAPAKAEYTPEDPAARQRALDEVQRLGGWYGVDENDPRKPVLHVALTGTEAATDATLTHLKALPNLRRLELGSTPVTDAGLAHLKGLTRLQVLTLDGTRVTDAGVEDLKQALPKVTVIR